MATDNLKDYEGFIEYQNEKSEYSVEGYAQALATLRDISTGIVDAQKTMERLSLENIESFANRSKKSQQELIDAQMAAQKALAERQSKLDRDRMKERWAEEDKHIDQNDKDAVAKVKKQREQEVKHQEKLEKQREKYYNKATKQQIKDQKRLAQEKATAELEANKKLLKSGNVADRARGLKGLFTKSIYDSETGEKVAEKFSLSKGLGNLAGSLISGMSDLAKQLENQIDTIGKYKGAIDTRLQGLNRSTTGGSYWDNISSNITGMAGLSPLIKQSALAERVNTMVGQGIAFNVEQRALLQELSGKIATTFNAANGTLLRLVRIQQQDTTAGRLGMESALTAFLNNMYQTTEYMQGIADSVKGSLEEAMSLMSGENALSFEYQVQKWMGSLYSVGMNQTSTQNLAGVIGQIAAGQLEGLTNGTTGNLAIMAANRAGLSIADLMVKGLDESSTNQLMEAMVDYLGEIYEETKSNRVIQQQYASIFGVTASDLRAVANLAGSTRNISRSRLSYNDALGRLGEMANSMYSRTSMGEIMTNAFDNIKYSMAAGIANNPALYAMYKAANLMDTMFGGFQIPFINTLFGGVDLHTSVADLLRSGALGGGIMSSIGTMIKAGGGGGLTGSGILQAAKIGSGLSTVSRGNGNILTSSGASVSNSGALIGNQSDSDLYNKTMSEANDNKQNQLAQATEEENQVTIKDVNENVVQIYSLLEQVTQGTKNLRVYVENTDDFKAEHFGGM